MSAAAAVPPRSPAIVGRDSLTSITSTLRRAPSIFHAVIAAGSTHMVQLSDAAARRQVAALVTVSGHISAALAHIRTLRPPAAPPALQPLLARASEAHSGAPTPLTAREQEVITLLAGRLQNREIAARLGVAPGTVKRHLDNIYLKLGVSGRRRPVAVARDRGLIPRPK